MYYIDLDMSTQVCPSKDVQDQVDMYKHNVKTIKTLYTSKHWTVLRMIRYNNTN